MAKATYRRLLNQLVRPEQLVHYREEIILPAVQRWMGRKYARCLHSVTVTAFAQVNAKRALRLLLLVVCSQPPFQSRHGRSPAA